MPFCPKCKRSYEDNQMECSNCKTALVPGGPDDGPVDSGSSEILLISINNEIEANVIESLLKGYGIPVLRKYREAGSYIKIYMGVTNLGIDLYVPSGLTEKAREVLAARPEMPDEAQIDDGRGAEDELAEPGRRNARRRKVLAWIMLLLIPGFIWFVFALVLNIVNMIFG